MRPFRMTPTKILMKVFFLLPPEGDDISAMVVEEIQGRRIEGIVKALDELMAEDAWQLSSEKNESFRLRLQEIKRHARN